MHPAPSVIFFSVFSGLGFGLMTWLGLGLPDVSGWSAFGLYFVAYGFAVGGLLASVFHLANPRNAIKAFSQWRSSWLSREGIAAVAALLVVAPYAIGRIFFDLSLPVLGTVGALLSVLTVFCTAMIYAQLKTVPRWNSWTTPVLFVTLMIGGGALLAGQTTAALVLLVVAAVVQIVFWRAGDRRSLNSPTNLGTATGLGSMGVVRQYEPPHTGTNYLLDEMVYQVGRKHARKLRAIAFVAAFLLPVLALLAFQDNAILATLIAVVLHVLGVLTSRWLFFAEARHVVANYYGK